MTQPNIFDSAPPQQGEFKKWDKVGAEVQGTYIDVREGVDGYGNDQMIYVIKDEDGKIWNVAFKKSNTIIMDRMKGARLGMILGFRYEEDRPSKKIEGRNAKIIRVYYSPNIVDKEWLDEQKKIQEQFGGPAETIAAPEPTPVTPDTPTPTTVEDAEPVAAVAPEAAAGAETDAGLKALRSLALEKGLTTAEMSESEQDATITAFLGADISSIPLHEAVKSLSDYAK
jgi:hypothetical protein